MNTLIAGLRKQLRPVKALYRRFFKPKEWQANSWQQKQDDFMKRCLAEHFKGMKGVLHVGGHLGEEYPLYKQAGAQTIVFFEPMPDVYKELRHRFKGYKDVVLVQKALGSTNETRGMYKNLGAGESSSFLKPTDIYEGHFDEKTVTMDVVTLDSFLPTLESKTTYNVLVTDTQGFDLEVLKGAAATLKQIDYIYTEVSEGHYHGEPKLTDFDAFLMPLGFVRVAELFYGSWKGADQWGDVCYVKNTAK
jgi:FkbM family methyltransferase